MKKHILILANSHKYNERCIAGVELVRKDKNTFLIRKYDGKVRWLRPVSRREHGEISSDTTNQMKILDIYEVEILEDCPYGFQSENVFINENSFKFIKSVVPDEKKLDKLIDDQLEFVFINNEKAVYKDSIAEVHNSLIFIKPENFGFIRVSNQYVQNQLRIEFSYKDFIYNLPVTDVSFLKEYGNSSEITAGIQTICLTISLGLEFKGWHYKLVAGIIRI
ncbi:MAG: hypothetical protein HXY49_11865 [Ignavibacteriaceae bacterium]|nr:hypothetical protein [Ignavibacteriaceae bacterium]